MSTVSVREPSLGAASRSSECFRVIHLGLDSKYWLEALGQYRIKTSPSLKETNLNTIYLLQTVSVVPEVVFGVHGLVVQYGVLSALDDLVPQNDLVDLKEKH